MFLLNFSVVYLAGQKIDREPTEGRQRTDGRRRMEDTVFVARMEVKLKLVALVGLSIPSTNSCVCGVNGSDDLTLMAMKVWSDVPSLS